MDEADQVATVGNLDQIVLRAAVLKILSDRVTAAYRAAKDEAAAILGPEGRKNAVLDNRKLAAVSVSKSGRITVDEAVLTAWVRRMYPSEVEEVTRIRPAFLDAIKKATESAGEPCTPLGDLDVPGITIGDPYPLVRKTEGADELIEQMWQFGRLTVDGEIKKLPVGDVGPSEE